MIGKTRKFGRYTLGEQLGSGGFGTVYKASDPIGRTVAIKVLKPGWSDDPGTIERFRREAKIAGDLFHNRIATIIDFDEFEGRFFLVMRFVDGLPLDQYLQEKGPLDWNTAIQILREVAEGLDYAHQHGFVHRDIKPANILISEKEGAVLTDFGLVKAAEVSGLTSSGVMLGTPHYIAPEVWEGRETNPGTDIYSLACVAFEMLTGKLLFTGKSPPEIMTQHILTMPKFPETWPEGVPDGTQVVLSRALAKKSEERYTSATEFVLALAQKGNEGLQEVELQAYALIQKAESLLKEKDFLPARELLTQADALTPGSPVIAGLLAQAEAGSAISTQYDEAVYHLQIAREKARAVFSADPFHSDPQFIFPVLGLLGEPMQVIAKKGSEVPNSVGIEKIGKKKKSPSRAGIASLILGILSLFFAITTPYSWNIFGALGILSLIIGIFSLAVNKKGKYEWIGIGLSLTSGLIIFLYVTM